MQAACKRSDTFDQARLWSRTTTSSKKQTLFASIGVPSVLFVAPCCFGPTVQRSQHISSCFLQVSAEDYYIEAEMAYISDDLDRARSCFQRALDLEPDVSAERGCVFVFMLACMHARLEC
jgi:hypothetical protein